MPLDNEIQDDPVSLEDPKPAAAPAPAYVTMEQFTSFTQQMQQMMNEGINNVANLVSRTNQPAPAIAHDDPEPTDDEIDSAALEGKGVGRAVKRAIAAQAKKLAAQAQADTSQIRDWGGHSLAQIALEQAKSKWKHYDRFKPAIDAALGQLTLEQMSQPMLLKRVYDMVIGEHQETLEKEAVEKAIRSQRETPDQGVNPGGAKPVTKSNELEPTTLFSSEDLSNLKRSGKSITHIASKLGKTPEQYLESVKRYQERGHSRTGTEG